jgi:hypothetical protein
MSPGNEAVAKVCKDLTKTNGIGTPRAGISSDGRIFLATRRGRGGLENVRDAQVAVQDRGCKQGMILDPDSR